MPAASVKSLGITLDNRLSLDQHVINVCKACYYHIRALRHLRDSLPDDVAKIVSVSIITSRLDYTVSLCYSECQPKTSRLQRVQNTLARVILRRWKFNNITPFLMELRWLPVQQRVHFKLAIITFNTIHTE